MEENLLLRDSEIFPTAKVLENALGKVCYDVYEELTKIITSAELDLKPEWNFYKDGKAWLCKVIYKKKTVFWLSIWDKHIKITFYFTDKTYHGVMELPIDEIIKQRFEQRTAVGKLIPLVLEIDKAGQLEDFKVIINYKKGLK
jgi:hypothetical protein